MRRFVLALGLVAVALAGVDTTPARGAALPDPCPPQPEGYARCLAQVAAVGPAPNDGLTPAELKQAYGWPTGPKAGSGKVIALVSAFHAPTIESDLAVFSAEFGLPACTTANGCFELVFARGVEPEVDPGWALESTLDVQWAHAVAPGAKIMLVEASSNLFADLFQAYQQAGLRGATYISNSWGADEFASQTIFDPLFTQFPAASSFFGSGDKGAAQHFFPASSPLVVSVGGTRVMTNTNGYKWSETGWTYGGGGCSLYYDASAVQSSFAQYPAVCAGKRAYPDVAALGDPFNGGRVYDSTPVHGESGWLIVGGTSLSTPIVAARAAITRVKWDAAYIYDPVRKFHDIIYGNNGFKAKAGYDLVTGRGRFRA